MLTPSPDHLAADPLDARQLVDAAEGVKVAVGQDVAHASRADTGDQAELVGGSGVQVDHALELGFFSPNG